MKTILLIEDNFEVRENTAEILELEHYNVLTAVNGIQGVRIAQSEKPDLIICDIMMPELDGYGVLHILGKDPGTASIPFIFFTSQSGKKDFRKGMSLGADDYLNKDMDETDLLNAIETRLKKSEIINVEYSKDAEGLNDFLDEANGLMELDNLSVTRELREFKKSKDLYREGDTPKFIYFINKGKVKTYKTNDAGKEFIIGLHNVGDFFGYTSMLEGKSYNETAEALEDSDIVLIPGEDFYKLLFNNRDVANKFINLLSNNLEEKKAKLLQLAYDSVRKRVAESLLMLHKKYNINEDNNTFIVSREDLASIAATTIETISRNLTDFIEEKIIKMNGKNIIILNPKKLAEMKN
jgi:CRP-like cAMP-binding protein/CheY-like chemotaxis protein